MQDERATPVSGKGVMAARLLDLAAEAIGLTGRLGRTASGRYIGGQLVRSCSSAGANYEEACAAESRADFIHKMQIVLKELREARYWLRLVRRASLAPADVTERLGHTAEALVRITARSVITAKARR